MGVEINKASSANTAKHLTEVLPDSQHKVVKPVISDEVNIAFSQKLNKEQPCDIIEF